MLELKCTLSKLLRSYEFLPVTNFEPIIHMETVLTSKNGIQVRIKRRKWFLLTRKIYTNNMLCLSLSRCKCILLIKGEKKTNVIFLLIYFSHDAIQKENGKTSTNNDNE